MYIYIYICFDLSRTNKSNTQITTTNKDKVKHVIVALLHAVLHNAVLWTQT